MSGTIPASLGNLTKLEVLSLTSGEQVGPRSSLSGSIPPELGQLTSLRFLNLFQNQLTGPIPPQLGNLVGLELLNLWGNALTGAVPTELSQLNSLLQAVLRDNQLSGAVPLAVVDRFKALSYACQMHNNPELYLPDTPAYRALDTDGDGRICNLSFVSASSAGAAVQSAIDDLAGAGVLNSGQANALGKKLARLRSFLETSDPKNALNLARAIVAQVEDFVADGVLSPQQASPLLHSLHILIDLLVNSP